MMSSLHDDGDGELMDKTAWWRHPAVPEAGEEGCAYDEAGQERFRDVLGFLREPSELNDFERKRQLEGAVQEQLEKLYPVEDYMQTEDELSGLSQSVAFAEEFVYALKRRSGAKELFELASKQLKESREAKRESEKRNNELMDLQFEEMTTTSFGGSPEEIASLVETHLKAREALQHEQDKTNACLLQNHIDEFRSLVDQIYSSVSKQKPTNADPKFQLLEQGRMTWRESRIQSSSTSQPLLLDALSKAKSLGKRVIGPWMNLVPKSLNPMGPKDEQAGWGLGLPLLRSSHVHVQMGNSYKVIFRLVAAVPAHPLQNILDGGNFTVWYEHAQDIYTKSSLTALILPVLGSLGDDFILQACPPSTEVHFASQKRSDQYTLHSNLTGAHIVIRGHDVKEALRVADSLSIVGRVIIPVDVWGTGVQEVTLMRKVKESLVDCATRRFVSGSKLDEIAFLVPSATIANDDQQKWLSNMSTLMSEVFE